MQKFFTDKTKLFECNIAIDGANLNETKARLILEFPNKRNLLFYGDINRNTGKCEVLIPALKEMDECEGNVLLEVIADSTYFESWSDKFKLQQNKKVVVEIYDSEKDIINEQNIKPVIEILNEDIIEEDNTYDNFKEYVVENNINIKSIKKNKKSFFKLLKEYKEMVNITTDDVVKIVEGIQKESKIL